MGKLNLLNVKGIKSSCQRRTLAGGQNKERLDAISNTEVKHDRVYTNQAKVISSQPIYVFWFVLVSIGLVTLAKPT